MISFMMLFIEPQMGFSGPTDYFNPEKVAQGYTSFIWLVGDLFYLTIFVATSLMSRRSEDLYLRWSALAAGILFLLVGAIDRVAAQLPFLMSGPELARKGLISLLPIRFAVLKVAALSLGFFAWTTTRTPRGKSTWLKTWRVLGYLVLILAILFIFIFIPLPIAFFIWSIGLMARELTGQRSTD